MSSEDQKPKIEDENLEGEEEEEEEVEGEEGDDDEGMWLEEEGDEDMIRVHCDMEDCTRPDGGTINPGERMWVSADDKDVCIECYKRLNKKGEAGEWTIWEARVEVYARRLLAAQGLNMGDMD